RSDRHRGAHRVARSRAAGRSPAGLDADRGHYDHPRARIQRGPEFRHERRRTVDASQPADSDGADRVSPTTWVRNAVTPHPAITAASGTAVPFAKAPTSAADVVPSTNCRVPRSADALPATRPCGAIANAVVFGRTKPCDEM